MDAELWVGVAVSGVDCAYLNDMTGHGQCSISIVDKAIINNDDL